MSANLNSVIKLISSMQKIGKMQDSVITGLLGGLIGTVVMDISNFLIFKIGKTEALYGHVSGQMFVSPFRTNQRKNFILGQILHLSMGSFFGIPLFYLLKKTGKDYYAIKGLVASGFMWGIFYAGSQKIGLFKKPRFTKTHYSAIWNNLIYGITSAYAIVSLADPITIKHKQANFTSRETNPSPYLSNSINNKQQNDTNLNLQ
ncbi:MAG: hypothetical protein ACYDEJ_12465 [Desulfitobacteriaceae bacterium]